MEVSNTERRVQVITPSIFKWDGSELKGFIDENIIEKIVIRTFEYWVISYNNERTVALIRKTKCYTPCIVDELKVLFGLQKLGTHYVKNGATYTILIRARTDTSGKDVITEYTLNNVDIKSIDDDIKSQIKQTYVFRDLLCLTKSTDSSLIIRKTPQQDFYVVSLIDSAIKLKKILDINKSTYLPEAVFKKWFKDNESPNKILYKMCRVYNSRNLTVRIFQLKCEIEKITQRVSSGKLDGLPDCLVAKISSKLQYTVT
jgi:hypothetical protein